MGMHSIRATIEAETPRPEHANKNGQALKMVTAEDTNIFPITFPCHISWSSLDLSLPPDRVRLRAEAHIRLAGMPSWCPSTKHSYSRPGSSSSPASETTHPFLAPIGSTHQTSTGNTRVRPPPARAVCAGAHPTSAPNSFAGARRANTGPPPAAKEATPLRREVHLTTTHAPGRNT